MEIEETQQNQVSGYSFVCVTNENELCLLQRVNNHFWVHFCRAETISLLMHHLSTPLHTAVLLVLVTDWWLCVNIQLPAFKSTGPSLFLGFAPHTDILCSYCATSFLSMYKSIWRIRTIFFLHITSLNAFLWYWFILVLSQGRTPLNVLEYQCRLSITLSTAK